MGPGSGRGAGFCAGYGVPGFLNRAAGPGAWGFGLGIGRGRGRGHRNMYWATGLTGWQRAGMGVPPQFYQPSAEQELGALQDQLKAMEQGIGHIQERIRELEKEQADEKKKA
jgi:hypothetical protein